MKFGQTEQPLITALYERLSRDDDQEGDSNSIVTQKRLLESYAKEHGFRNCVHYTDDGWSGGTFERPDWKRMIADIEAGKVGAVLVKDMSRVGRDYLQTGFYTEVFFQKHNVRFIAIYSGVDSADQKSGEFAPFLNIMNEWYLRDASRKLKQSYQARARANISFSNKTLYGYRKDPERKHHLIIDEESAAVVRQIYAYALQGDGPAIIARKLREQKIERPSYYMATHGLELYATDLDRPYDWSNRTVGNILRKIEYLGHTVNHRTERKTYKSKKEYLEPSEWQIIENTHEPIIDQATFDAVQKIRGTVRRTDTTGEPNVLTGLVYCGDCGSKMYNHRGKSKDAKHVYAPDPQSGLLPADAFQCREYSVTSRRETKKCFSHYITTQALREIALSAIRSTATFAIQNRAEFLRRVRETSAAKQSADAKVLQQRIKKTQKRIDELDRLFVKLYEDYAYERIPLKRYEQIAAMYEAEQTGLKKVLTADQKELATFDRDTDRAEQFLFLAKKYTDFSVLTNEMLLAFVDRIVVYGATRICGVKLQNIEIFLKHIGKVELPDEAPPVIPTPEEYEAEKQRRKREYDRKYYYEKRKPKDEAKKAAMQKAPKPDTVSESEQQA